jgi:hypothetical protein
VAAVAATPLPERHPREGGDPRTLDVAFAVNGTHIKSQRPWVPAFAGTTRNQWPDGMSFPPPSA